MHFKESLHIDMSNKTQNPYITLNNETVDLIPVIMY